MLARLILSAAPLALLAAGSAVSAGKPAPDKGAMDLRSLPKLGTVSERYQAYNVEMVEVTGGRFWAPYGGPAGEVYRQRPPINLSDPRLVAMARHLAPSLMRVSGTWANNTYLAAEGETLSAPPEGFRQVLTPQQWAGVVAFSKAVDAPIVTSFAVSTGTRDAAGNWTTAQAQRFADLTKSLGGTLYAAEFFNEPNAPGAAQGTLQDYSAADYGRDFRIFRDWARKAVPDMKIIGPGSVGEGGLITAIPVNSVLGKHISTADMMSANPGSVDAVSYHFYGTVSQRCAHMGIGTADKGAALSAEWLDRTLQDFNFYAALRDKYEPGKPIWNTETAQAACGGSPWASTFLDSFRYLNQLGLLAQKGVQVVMHNTLAASDYALIDQDTLAPRPNYWAAVLWARTMGSTVLASPRTPAPEVRIYAHCLLAKNGGVGLVALNTGTAVQTIAPGGKAQSWVLTGQPLDTREVRVNGRVPSLDAKGELQGLTGQPTGRRLTLPGQSIAFVAVPNAGNPACK